LCRKYFLEKREGGGTMSKGLGARIKGLRKLKSMNQKELSSKLNISVSMLSNIERGVKKPGRELLEKMAWILEVPGEELFFFSNGEEVDQ